MGLDALISKVKAHQPRVLSDAQLAHAGVLVAITDELEPKVILTLRSTEMPTHKGEVAFPGGKREDHDEDIIATALREAQEEIDLDPIDVQVVGTLNQVISRYGFLVTPVLAIVPEQVALSTDSHEIDAIFKVPLSFFLDGEPDQIDQFGNFKGPRWYFEDYTIWGLTAMMLAEMFNQFFDAEFELLLGSLDGLMEK
ncbi:MAG: CoA pyrophosphatase [Bermanella sp.]|nr:CoA pyrophosphatase [Bermanella sp.]|tara:strand:+ start:3988 stop:4578 length:591 start_codon:yes stop_codon:yes gene_type:complete